MSETRITVLDVFRSLGVEPTSKHTRWAGSEVARVWRRTTGTETVLERRPNAAGRGLRAACTYPESWRPEIEAVVRCVVERGPVPPADLPEPVRETSCGVHLRSPGWPRPDFLQAVAARLEVDVPHEAPAPPAGFWRRLRGRFSRKAIP